MKRFLMILAIMLGSFIPLTAEAISDTQKGAIIDHCLLIRENLGNVQKSDAKVRVYLGGYYESILSKFIVPLNVRLVENNLSNAGFVENQNGIADTKTLFSNDFVSYQQDLEELVMMDCKQEPEKFYEKLEKVRQKRKIVEQDVLKMRSLFSEHVRLVNQLEGKL